MKNSSCLKDQDLILYHYGDTQAPRTAAEHLAACPACEQRLKALREDLARVPRMEPVIDSMAQTRMAARVTEQLGNRRRKAWLPAFGATAVAAFALVIMLTQTPQQPDAPQITQVVSSPANGFSLEESMPDIDFLEDLELLQELELLTQIEGV